MVSINYAFKEIISKIVYYGPGLSGKTTNLQHVFKKIPQDTRGELISLAISIFFRSMSAIYGGFRSSFSFIRYPARFTITPPANLF